MKRHKNIIALSQDHHHGLLLSQLIKKGAPNYAGLPTDIAGKVEYAKRAWKEELKIHFDNEEKILFPAVKGKNNEIDYLIEEICAEHEMIKSLIDKLEYSPASELILNELGELLESHIRKEERILFEKIQVHFETELNDLGEIIFPVKNVCKKD